MASPGNTFKNSLFGQLKSYSNAVQGAFEQRIARPLLAFKRDLSRPTSETRGSIDSELVVSNRPREESTSSSSPLEIIDIDSSGSFKSIFDKVKNTLSPSIKRRISENPVNNESKVSSEENSNSSVSVLSDKNSRKHRFQHHKSVSFAENVDNDDDSDQNNRYSTDDRNKIERNARKLADQILTASIDEAVAKTRPTTNILSKKNNDDDDFERDFHQKIKPRRLSIDNMEDLIYQDLSAEIVAYVLKHAVRTLKREQDDLAILKDNQTEHDEDFIDLK